MIKIINLALSYFSGRLPSEYLRRYSVSLSSSGWGRSGSTGLKAPGILAWCDVDPPSRLHKSRWSSLTRVKSLIKSCLQ